MASGLATSQSALSQSLPAQDLMPSSEQSTSSTGRRHNSIAAPQESRAFYNSHYPRPPKHRPQSTPAHDLPVFTLPPSPPAYQHGDSMKMSGEFTPSSVSRDGFPEFHEMSRSLTGGHSFSAYHHHRGGSGSGSTSSFGMQTPSQIGRKAVAMRGGAASSKHRRDSDDGLIAQMDGLDISAKSSSPTVLSVLTEFSLSKRSARNTPGSIISALSAPSTLQRAEHQNATSESRNNSVVSDAMAAVPEHGIFAFDDEDLVMGMGEMEMSPGAPSGRHVPTAQGMMGQWRGVM